MKKILFPTDFSNNSYDALEFILAMNRGQALELKIVHASDPANNMQDAPMSTIQLIKTLTDVASASLRKMEQRITNDFNNGDESWKVTTEVLIGNPSIKIVDHAVEYGADLIVLGNKGENYSISDKLLGITSLTLTDEAPCPILLIPKDYKYEGLENVVYPTNLDYSDPYILWKSMNVVSPHKPVIRCLHVKSTFETQLAEQEAFAKYMVDHSPSIQTIFHTEDSDDTEDSLMSFVETYNCQMVIMHKTKRSFFNKIFSKSITKKMRRHVNVPLLIMNIK